MSRLFPEETVVQLYEGNTKDSMTLLSWWMELVESDELDKILFPSTHSLGSFMHYFQPSKVRLVYCPDENGKIELAFWGEPVAPGIIFLSLWARSSLRHTRRGVQMVLDIYRQIFDTFHVVCGVTKQERLLKVHAKLGYKVIAKVPKLWSGIEDAWLVILTKEDFYVACGRE